MKNDSITSLVLSVAGDELGAAWLIARARPDIKAEVLAKVARGIARRDQHGRGQRIGDETREQTAQRVRQRELDRQAARRTDADDIARVERAQAEASEICALLGDLAEPLLAGQSQRDIAAARGVSPAAICQKIKRALAR